MPKKFNYKSACKKLCAISKFGSKPGLSRITKLLSLLSNPQNNFKCILISGTNGKGSTVKFLSKILSSAGFCTGAFYSPSIFSFCERIQINNKWINKSEFAELFNIVAKKFKYFNKNNIPTFFETLCAMAFLHFSKKKCNYAVMEVGMGGRLDATNACTPILSIITSIGIEHTRHLGNSIQKIAFEKAGIMRANIPVICGAEGIAKKEIKKIAKQKHSKFYEIKKGYNGKLKAAGSFQKKNASLAFIAAKILGIKNSIIKKSLSSATMPARWEKISSFPKTIIDCAHNPHAASALLPDLKKDFSEKTNSPRILLFAAMKDKNYLSVLQTLLPFFDIAIFCTLPFPRAENINSLSNSFKKLKINKKIIIKKIKNPHNALKKAKSISGKKGRILCIGSTYLLQYLFGEEEFRIMG
ncbi:MAG: Mur ligase family protein [Candidatus Micrarchaeota archaeon]